MSDSFAKSLSTYPPKGGRHGHDVKNGGEEIFEAGIQL
jgi:hypothetical protein